MFVTLYVISFPLIVFHAKSEPASVGDGPRLALRKRHKDDKSIKA